MSRTITYKASAFLPTTSVGGDESPTVFRGKNVVLQGLETRPKFVCYSGSKDLQETYNLATETLTGTVTWTAGSAIITGTTTRFTEELHIGQMLLSGTEVFVVARIDSDTQFTADRPPTSTVNVGQVVRFLPVLFEIDKQRGVLRRGNAIKVQKKDIFMVGDGRLHLNGVNTNFQATRKLQRVQSNIDGSLALFPVGFPQEPPAPVIDPLTGGGKGMLAGRYSFMMSYYNSTTGGFSNPCPVIKNDSTGQALTLVAGGRFQFNLTGPMFNMPANADGFVIWGSLSGGGIQSINLSNASEGAWYEVRRIRVTPRPVDPTGVNTTDKTLYSVYHRLKTGEPVQISTTGSLPTGLLPNTWYYVIVEDFNRIKLATTYNDAVKGVSLNFSSSGTGQHSINTVATNKTTFVEYLDAEIGLLASGNNNAPPDAEFVVEFANTPFVISCLGRRTNESGEGSSPGNYVIPMKSTNKEATPFDWATSVGEEITGVALGIGRLFCLTSTGLPFVTPTGRTELARLVPSLQDIPFTSRPFWTKGGINPYNVAVVQGDVYMFSGGLPLRSPSQADERTVPFDMGTPVSDITQVWASGHVLVVHDPKNQQVCFISSASKKNKQGYWVSEILPFNLKVNAWMPIIELSSEFGDRIVSGAAIVNQRMEFLAGGRTSTGAIEMRTYRYDEQSDTAEPIDYYIAMQPTDLNSQQLSQQIRAFRLTAKMTAPKIQIHGASWGGEFSVSDIEDGKNPIASITFPTSTAMTKYLKEKLLVKNLQLWCLRLSGRWNGAGKPDQIDEIGVDVEVRGGDL